MQKDLFERWRDGGRHEGYKGERAEESVQEKLGSRHVSWTREKEHGRREEPKKSRGEHART